MAFTLPNFRALTPQDMGSFDPMSSLRAGLTANNALQEARFKPKNLQEQLLSAQLTNKINQAKADYAQRNEEAGLQNVLSGTKGNNLSNAYKEIQNRFAPQTIQANLGRIQAQTTGAQAAANKSAMIQKMMEQIMGGEQQQVQVGQPKDQIKTQNEPSNPNMTYAQSALASKLMGFGDPKIIDVDGKKIAVTPFGQIPIATGLNETQKQLAKGDAKQVQDLESGINNAMTSQSTLDSLSKLISGKAFESIRQHPVLGKYELSYFSKFGSPEEQAVANQFLTETGEIIKNSAKDFHGQFRVGEQALLNSMKPSPSDSIEGARAKTEALSYMNKMLMERSKVSAELIRSGVSPTKAYQQADQQINGDEIRKQIHQSMNKNNNQEEKTINGVTYIKEDGKWFHK